MTTLNPITKPTKQQANVVNWRNTPLDKNTRHGIMRRATLTNTPISTVMKEYCAEGVKNDPFLQMFQ